MARLLGGSFEPITSLYQVRDIARYSMLHRGSGRLDDTGGLVSPEPPFEPFEPTMLTSLDRWVTGVTAPIHLNPLQRWFGSKRPVVSDFVPDEYPPLDVRVLRVLRSTDTQVTMANTMQFFLSLVPSLSVVSW